MPLKIETHTKKRSLKIFIRNFIYQFAYTRINKYLYYNKYKKNILRRANDIGLINTMVPTKYGGIGLSLSDNIIIAEELSFQSLSIAVDIFIDTYGFLPLMMFGKKDQKERFLSILSSSNVHCGSMSYNMNVFFNSSLRAKLINSRYILEGYDIKINGSDKIYWVLVHAQTRMGYSIFLIDLKLSNLVIKKESFHIKYIDFKRVSVHPENRLGEEGEALLIYRKTLNLINPIVSSMYIGNSISIIYNLIKIIKNIKYDNNRHYRYVSYVISELFVNIETFKIIVQKSSNTCKDKLVYKVPFANCKLYSAELMIRCSIKSIKILLRNRLFWLQG